MNSFLSLDSIQSHTLYYLFNWCHFVLLLMLFLVFLYLFFFHSHNLNQLNLSHWYSNRSSLYMTKPSHATLPHLLITKGHPYLSVNFLISNPNYNIIISAINILLFNIPTFNTIEYKWSYNSLLLICFSTSSTLHSYDSHPLQSLHPFIFVSSFTKFISYVLYFSPT